jgi:hypothetical protein
LRDWTDGNRQAWGESQLENSQNRNSQWLRLVNTLWGVTKTRLRAIYLNTLSLLKE